MAALQIGALAGLVLLFLALSALNFAWWGAIGYDRAAIAFSALVASSTAVVSILGLLVAGDRDFIPTKFLRLVRIRILHSNTGAAVLIAGSAVGLAIIGAAYLTFRPVKISADRDIWLMSYDVGSHPMEIGEFAANTERLMLLPVGERHLGYRIPGCQQTVTLAPQYVPSAAKGPIEPIFIKTEGCYEALP